MNLIEKFSAFEDYRHRARIAHVQTTKRNTAPHPSQYCAGNESVGRVFNYSICKKSHSHKIVYGKKNPQSRNTRAGYEIVRMRYRYFSISTPRPIRGFRKYSKILRKKVYYLSSTNEITNARNGLRMITIKGVPTRNRITARLEPTTLSSTFVE